MSVGNKYFKTTCTSFYLTSFSAARSMHRTQQTEQVLDAMAKKDLEGLRKLARRPEGFVDDKLRQYVWYSAWLSQTFYKRRLIV